MFVSDRSADINNNDPSTEINNNACVSSQVEGADSLQGMSSSHAVQDVEDDDERPTAEQVELEHNVWDFTDPTLIMDSVLFNDEPIDFD